jgi:hypothetical protein
MRQECVRGFALSLGRLLETLRHPIVNSRLQECHTPIVISACALSTFGRRRLNASKAGKEVKRFPTKKALYLDLGL